MVAWNRRVGIVGVGQTHHRSHRPDVNQLEMINEAVRAALEDAKLTPKDIDTFVIGNMELFEGNYQPDMWHVDGYGGYLKPGIRLTTGGTTGGMLCCAAINLVASGMYDVAMAVGWEKQMDSRQTTTGVTNMADPLWHKWLQTGVIGGGGAAGSIREFGKDVEMTAARLRVQIADNASRNPYSHLRQKLTTEDVMNSRLLVYPLRLLHMCPQSDGACCVIFASEEKAKKLTNKPVWVKDHVTVHREGGYGARAGPREKSTMRVCAEKLYQRNGIKNPLKEIDVFEMYDPSVWMHLAWLEEFLLLPHGENLKMVDRGDTARDGVFPINPSGGVVATNPIGATAMIRVAEAALQVRGDAGEHQVTKEVKTAMASSFGGTGWTILHLLTKELN